jgi:xyloglucan O-acetyltransferase
LFSFDVDGYHDLINFQVESPQNTFSDLDRDKELTKWHFETYNFTVLYAWSKFLVRTEERRVNGSGPKTHVFLDEIDPHWVQQLHHVNYAVLSGGHWFFTQLYLYQHKKLIGSALNSDKGIPVLGVIFAYQSAFRTALNYLKYNAAADLRLVVLRTFAPAHFESGAWNKGGLCERTRPNLDTGPLSGNHLEMRDVQLDEIERAQNGSTSHVRFVAMDVTLAMEMRPDGHPGSHWDNRWNHGYSDCVHWCMPGAVDTWNEILFQTIK